MKLALFGATGATGQRVVQYALERGHEVVALVRNPAGLASFSDPRLRVVRGDVLDPVAVESVVREADAVLSTLGVRTNRPQTTVSTGVRHIVAAMKQHGLRRLLVVSSGLVNEHIYAKESWFVQRLVAGFLLNEMYADLHRMHEVLAKEAAWLDFTILCPGMLVPAEPTRAYCVAVDAEPAGGAPYMPFADVALCMLDVVEQGSYLRQSIGMSTPHRVQGSGLFDEMRALLWENVQYKLLRTGILPGVLLLIAALAWYVAVR